VEEDRGDIGTLRQIAGDPHGFILRQGWASLDFREEEQVARLRKLWESLELEILSVLEATNGLRESAEWELYDAWWRSRSRGWKRRSANWRTRRSDWGRKSRN